MSEGEWWGQKLRYLLKFEVTEFLSEDFSDIFCLSKEVACDVTRLVQHTQTHC